MIVAKENILFEIEADLNREINEALSWIRQKDAAAV